MYVRPCFTLVSLHWMESYMWFKMAGFSEFSRTSSHLFWIFRLTSLRVSFISSLSLNSWFLWLYLLTYSTSKESRKSGNRWCSRYTNTQPPNRFDDVKNRVNPVSVLVESFLEAMDIGQTKQVMSKPHYCICQRDKRRLPRPRAIYPSRSQCGY